MATNEQNKGREYNVVEETLILGCDNGIITTAEDMTDDPCYEGGDCRYLFSFEGRVESASGKKGSAYFIATEFFTAREVRLLRELLRNFRLARVSLGE